MARKVPDAGWSAGRSGKGSGSDCDVAFADVAWRLSVDCGDEDGIYCAQPLRYGTASGTFAKKGRTGIKRFVVSRRGGNRYG